MIEWLTLSRCQLMKVWSKLFRCHILIQAYRIWQVFLPSNCHRSGLHENIQENWQLFLYCFQSFLVENLMCFSGTNWLKLMEQHLSQPRNTCRYLTYTPKIYWDQLWIGHDS